jgi:hypothetical protein
VILLRLHPILCIFINGGMLAFAFKAGKQDGVLCNNAR